MREEWMKVRTVKGNFGSGNLRHKAPHWLTMLLQYLRKHLRGTLGHPPLLVELKLYEDLGSAMDMTYLAIACTIALGLAYLGYKSFSFLHHKIRQSDKNRYEGEITTVADPRGARFEIVAVHGLAANPNFTWGNDPKGKKKTVDLLKVLLRDDFQAARILSFTHNSDWLVGAPAQSAPVIGQKLLDQLTKERQSRPKLPIIFIGHSFGGIIIKQALSASKPEQDVSKNTRGIIFLGTPHQGTSVSNWGTLLTFLTSFLGSDNTLLLYLKKHNSDLSNLEAWFKKWVEQRPRKVKVECFYEMRPTFIFGLSIGFVSLSITKVDHLSNSSKVVNRDSATGRVADEAQQMNTNHTGMTKFRGPEDKQYRLLKATINKLIPSDQEYEYICKNIYTVDKLRIERLSKQPLAIDQCYINLAMLFKEDAQFQKNPSEDTAYQFTSSRSRRLNIETPAKERQVELPTLFDSRETLDGIRKDPRRILIRGNAGIGKTTLCKKIVHDFTHGSIWKKFFDRILWVRLRDLKELKYNGDLYDMFCHIYFWGRNGAIYADPLSEFMKDKQYRSRSLFVLDGLDEVVHLFSKSELLMDLLKMPSIIIATRPHIVIPPSVPGIDLELETIGFYPDQVRCYVEKVTDNTAEAQLIRSFLQKHWLLQSLVRIPIQLDALCLIWGQDFERDPIPETMTGVYKAICHQLWRKDIDQLGIIEAHQASEIDSTDVRHYAKPEMEFLELLAFSGLHDNIFEFDAKYRTYISDQVERRGKCVVPFGELPGKLSFLRTSDTLKIAAKQSYHFLHLTFQEFFAAQYFVKQWEAGEDLKYMDIDSRKGKSLNITPESFLQKNKYNTRYEIVWRFTAGLLHGQALANFFHEIEHKSPDYLGPVHQRLVMHCLSEVNALKDLRIRSDLDTRLLRWLLFECDLTDRPLLVRENEFPDTVLRKALRVGSDSQKIGILGSLRGSTKYLSKAIVTDLGRLLKGAKDKEVKYHAFQALEIQSNLPDETLNYLLSQLKKPQRETSLILEKDIAYLIGTQRILPTEVIATLVGSFRGNDRRFQILATETLGYRWDLGDENVTSLLASLEEIQWSDAGNPDERDVRGCISRALRNTSSFPEKAIEILERLLESTNSFALAEAVSIMERVPKLSEKATVALIRIFETGSHFTPYGAVDALKVHKNLTEKAVKALIRLLQTAPWHKRHDAATILACQSNLSPETKTALKVLTEDSNAVMQYIAALALKEESSLSKQTVEALLREFERSDQDHLHYAIDALSKQSNTSEQIITGLVALLKSADVKTSRKATEILKTQIYLSESMGETLVELLEDKNSNLRDHAAEILKNKWSLPKKTIKTLLSLLNNKYSDIRLAAAQFLGNQSSLSQKTIETLLSLLNNNNSDIRLAAAEVLGKQSLLSESDMDLVRKLCNSSTSRQDIIVGALGRKSNLSKEAIAVLTQLLEGKDAGYQEAAALALTGQSNLPEETIGVLMTLFERGGPNVQYKVSQVLNSQTMLSDKHSATVVSLLTNSNGVNIYPCSIILSKRSGWSDNIALKLAELLVDTDDSVRSAAAEVLGRQSKLSRKVATHCVELLQHADNEVRNRVARIISDESILVRKIIEALELSSESKASAGDTTSSAKTSQTMKALYGAFLYCSFEQQYWLQVNKDSTLTINHPNGSWTIHLSDPLSELQEWRRFWGFHDYKIPLTLEEPEPILEEV
ncbi:hypothetical protein FHL15_010920 [Xylaria flabelliformis]|uniref:Protein SERAC1 n=1 Tax=Xylaria flabelliformis TaxID=2512241 RepID=A0A553HJN5_9PEZI|nr:hypothetical protein FHL15_010920 [Xylaria flabelliformis]